MTIDGRTMRTIRKLAIPLEERFFANVDVRSDDECWLWQAGANGHGYGYYIPEKRALPAHRVAYELIVGPLPPGCHLHHVCETPLCVNPRHLKPLTPSEHSRLSNRNTGKTYCIHGHAFTPGNTYWSNGKRGCKLCAARRARERSARKVGA